MFTQKNEGSGALPSPSPGKSPQQLCFNLLPFRYPQVIAKMCFTPIAENGLYPFEPGDVPQELAARIPPGQERHLFYTNGLADGPGLPLSVNLTDHPALARLWCTQQLRRLLEPAADYCLHEGAHTTHLWYSTARFAAVKTEKITCIADTQLWELFHRFTLRMLHHENRPHPELLVGYNGIGLILKFSINDLVSQRIDLQYVRQVAFRGKIYPWNDLPASVSYHLNETLPLLHGMAAHWIDFSIRPQSATGDTVNSYPLIDAFTRMYLLNSEFAKITKPDSRFREVDASDTGSVASAGGKLLFGEGGVASVPAKGMKKFGPLQLPPGSRFSCFIICFEDDKPYASNLCKHLIGPDAAQQLGPYLRIYLNFSHDHWIFLNSNSDAVLQLEQCLKEMVFAPDHTWCAFFISPGAGRLSPDEAEHLHCCITEQLLHRGVLVQKVETTDLEDDVTDPSRLPGVDMVTRLGGIPWRPACSNPEEPVVGFALHRIDDLLPGEVGAAVFFAPGGVYSGATPFCPDNEREWGGLAMAFFRKWELRGCSWKRLVLHLPRPLKPHEMKLLQQMINEEKPGLQVVVMVISRCGSSDIQAFNSASAADAPPDGTWVRCRADHYLLYTGQPSCDNDKEPAAVVPLNIHLCLINPGEDTTEKLAPALLDQVHRLTSMHRPRYAPSHLPVTLAWSALLACIIPRLRNEGLPENVATLPWFL